MHHKFIKDKEALEFKIKEFKEEKKSFDNTYNSFNDRINMLNCDIINTNKAKENLNINKALFAMLNTNLNMGHTDKQIEDNIKAKYINKNYITFPAKINSPVIKKKKVDSNTLDKVI